MTDLQHAMRLQHAVETSSVGRARHALVSAVDPGNHAVKVMLQPENVVSGWIPDPGLACAGLKIVCPCEVGTQVLVIPVEGDAEHPVVVARIFDTVVQPPVSPATGKPVQPGEIGIFLDNGNFLHMSSAGLTIKGDLTLQGSFSATGDVVAGTISLTNHVHGQVTAGNAITGTAQG